MKTTAKTIKLLFLEMETAEAAADKAEAVYTKNPTLNHEIKFDTAYRISFNATERLIKELCLLGYDAKTWRRVLATKRAEVRGLCFGLQK